MKKSLLFAIVTCGAILTSCKTPVATTSRTAETMKMPVETWAQWTTSDLEVSSVKARLTVEAPKNKNVVVTESALRENAVGELLEKNNADILVNPLYTTEYVDGRIVSVTVSGYPARHTHFRNISFEEQSKYMIEKAKVENAPQIVINGGEIVNKVEAPAPAPAPADQSPAPTHSKSKSKK
jgi:hypothetical protein